MSMPRIRTFVDSGVLISAFKGELVLRQRAQAILKDRVRDFISSDFVRLEVLPKPTCYGRKDEREFYELFFGGVKRMIPSTRTLVSEAQTEAEAAGLSAVDALHVAAAKRGNATN
jgi:predicted nucleic acid-binding protein